MDTPFLLRGLLLDQACSSLTSLFPLGMVLSFSEPYSVKVRPHVAVDHITSVPWKAALWWYRIRNTGIWFVFPPVIITSQHLSQFSCTPQETKFHFVLAGLWLSFCLFGRHHDFHASDEKENWGGTNDACYSATYFLSSMSPLRCHLIGSSVPYWNEDQNTGSSSKGDKEFAASCRRISVA